jgi:teichuronic acid biosynthesis glycosyltransferase TuaC
VRALVISDMQADAASPERGRFVRDQVAALRRVDDVEVELIEFPPGPRALAAATVSLLQRFHGPDRDGGTRRRGEREPVRDVVHAHFGLTAWPALAIPARVRALTVHGTDVRHPRTRLATAAALPLMNIVAAASQELTGQLPLRSARARALVLPCGVDTERFTPIARADARRELGLAPEGPYLLFPADPRRPEKRCDRAVAIADAVGARLLTLGGIAPEHVPLWVNAANGVLVPSEREGFGLAVLEALACDVPVLATPVGVHPQALREVAGTLCAPYELSAWRDAAHAIVAAVDPRIEGREAAERFSALRMAERVAGAWREGLARSAEQGG